MNTSDISKPFNECYVIEIRQLYLYDSVITENVMFPGDLYAGMKISEDAIMSRLGTPNIIEGNVYHYKLNNYDKTYIIRLEDNVITQLVLISGKPE